MGRTRKVGSAGRFEARAGATIRKRLAAIEVVMRQRHQCPQCMAKTVKRVSIGIWACKRCGHKFAGGAYVPQTKLGEMARRARVTGTTL